MRFWFVFSMIYSGFVFAKLSVSVSYSALPESLKRTIEQLESCQKREWPEVGCIEKIFSGVGENEVRLACGPNLPDKSGDGCVLVFLDNGKPQAGKFRMRMSKAVSLKQLRKRYAEIVKQLEVSVGPQHFNLGNPLNDFADGVNYVCERSEGSTPWSCYLDLTEPAL